MADKSKSGVVKSFFGKLFANPPEDDDDVYGGESNTGKSVYETLHGDQIMPVKVEDDHYYYSNRNEEEDYMRQTNIKPDMSAYTSNAINMEVMKPEFSFQNGNVTLEGVEEDCKDIIEALKENRTVFLDLFNLGDGERSVATYVVLGAVKALGYKMTNIRDHVMYVLTPPGVNVSQDDRVKFEADEDRRLKYSNDYN
ncbi:MAG: cell division protein SepF [Bacillota bacterium]|nr:cell division protein SepF [Bacillota bacterium]